ncbi:MAG: hypothetical protein U1E08_05365 [Coriobacteriia bacterium]|nr:hypothetical protein [Coriobacteriia bacterium]
MSTCFRGVTEPFTADVSGIPRRPWCVPQAIGLICVRLVSPQSISPRAAICASAYTARNTIDRVVPIPAKPETRDSEATMGWVDAFGALGAVA